MLQTLAHVRARSAPSIARQNCLKPTSTPWCAATGWAAMRA